MSGGCAPVVPAGNKEVASGPHSDWIHCCTMSTVHLFTGMMRFGGGFNGGGFNNAGGSGYRDIGSVTCFRCWQKGHYANNCPNPKVPPPPDHPEAHLDRNRGWQN